MTTAVSPPSTSVPSAGISSKPAYEIPSVQQIRAISSNGLKLASLFSGCGGSCLGFRMLGFDVVYANEFIPAARDTYRANYPETFLDPRDVRAVHASDITAAAKGAQIDVLEGSPPCAAFSTAGVREKGWSEVRSYSDTKQRVDDLFFEFARILRELQPRAFVAENVAGLVVGNAKGYFLQILDTLKSCGYRVEARVLDSQWLGVPQHRRRLIFVGAREDLRVTPKLPKPLAYRYTLDEVLPDLARVNLSGRPDNWQSCIGRTMPTIVASSAATSPTAYFSAAFVETRAGERRRLTIEEVKLLSTFPHDFRLTGTFEQQWERVARAVPPIMMRSVASCVEEMLCH